MIVELGISSGEPRIAFSALQKAWKNPTTKVVVLRASDQIEDVRTFYDNHFACIGSPAHLAEDAAIGGREEQRTGEVWAEVRYDPKFPDAYRHSANAQPLHTDGSYIPGYPNATLMVCVVNAGEGGETTFIDSIDVVEALSTEDPDLLELITSRMLPHARSGDRRVEKVIDLVSNPVLVNWNYYCVDPNLAREDQDIADRFFDYLNSSVQIKNLTRPVKLGPGDAVVWKDREIFHGRNGFVATAESERFLWKCAIDVGVFDG